MKDDFTNDSGKWLPEEGFHNIEIVSMAEGTSRKGNPKYELSVVSAEDYGKGLKLDLTNIPGKRWLLRQLLEACGIEPEKDEEGKTVYDWDSENFTDIVGKVVSAQITHDKTPFIGRDGKEMIIPKAKIVAFKKVTV